MRDEGADAYQDVIDYIDEAPREWTAEMIVDGVLARCERLKEDRGARPAQGELTFTREEHDKLMLLVCQCGQVPCACVNSSNHKEPK